MIRPLSEVRAERAEPTHKPVPDPLFPNSELCTVCGWGLNDATRHGAQEAGR